MSDRTRARLALSFLIPLIVCGCLSGTPAAPVSAAADHDRSAPPPTTAASSAPAAAAPDAGHCVSASSMDLTRLLPPPPAAQSAQERSELDEMLRLQAERTPSAAERARQDAELSIFRFGDALGNPAGFTPAKLPLTVMLFRDVARDEAAVMNVAKDRFERPRPFRVEHRLAPVVPMPSSASYPSGHSTWAYASALVLADMLPERRAQILARADEYAHNRILGGVHYPSDVQAGRLAGTALAAMLFACAPFTAEESAARRELRAALGLQMPVNGGDTPLR